MQPIKYPMRAMLMVLALGIMALFASDIYTPALPAIHYALNATARMTQWTVTIYFLGLGIAPLIFGPLSDAMGRRKLLILACILAVIGSAICVAAFNMSGIIIGRGIQGIGLGIGISLSRTVARDLFEGVQLAKVAAMLAVVMGLGPVVAPLLGSYLQHWFGWQSIFYCLLVYLVVVTAGIYFFLPETIKEKSDLQPSVIVKSYFTLLSNLTFMCNSIASAVATGALISFFIVVPFLLQITLKMSVTAYGWVITSITVMTLLSRFVNIYLVKKFSCQQIVLLGLLAIFMAAIGLFAVGIMKGISVITIIIPAMLLVFGTGLIYSNALVEALMPFRSIGGTAGALFGSMQMLGGFIATAIASHLAYNNIIFIALEMLALGSFAIMLVILASLKARRILQY